MIKTGVIKLFLTIEEQNPLIHHITNTVTINDCANATLAVGASPVMATSIEEVEQMVRLADALVINFGTIQVESFIAMILAGKAANKKGIPVIFDPVGVGSTKYRKEKAKEFLSEVRVAVIRGNASEINSLTGGTARTRGVDSGESAMPIKELAIHTAKLFSCVAVVSGEFDTISTEHQTVQIENGHRWLKRITGTGCMATSLIGCFAGITEDYFLASVAGMSVMSVAGEKAKRHLQKGEGIGTYRVKLMDEIFNMNEHIWEKEVLLREP